MKIPKTKPARGFNNSVNSADKSNALLNHILSPLELSAFKHEYKPFSYKINGRFIYFSGYACKALMTLSTQKMKLLQHRLDMEEKAARVPRKLREVFEDPAEILSLPPYTRNRLCKYECYTMLEIISRGRTFFLDKPEFGKKSIAHLDNLLKKYGCSGLFT